MFIHITQIQLWNYKRINQEGLVFHVKDHLIYKVKGVVVMEGGVMNDMIIV